MKKSARAADDLQSIPGVGPSIAEDLEQLGFHRVADLAGQDAQKMYETLCAQQGLHIDRCVLYVFRCATYYAGTKNHDAELLKWWNWKDPADVSQHG